jgi:hypothetical protein
MNILIHFQHKIKQTNKNEFPKTGIASITNVKFRIKFHQTNIFNTTETEATDSIQTFKLDICLQKQRKIGTLQWRIILFELMKSFVRKDITEC